MAENFLESKRGNRYPGIGSIESPKEDKQTQTKTQLKWQKLKRILEARREKQSVARKPYIRLIILCKSCAGQK